MICIIKFSLVWKYHLNSTYHQHSLGLQVPRFMFSNKTVTPLPWSGLMPQNNVKDVFTEPKEIWHWAIVKETKPKTHNNPETKNTTITLSLSEKSLNSEGQKIPSQIWSCFAYSLMSSSYKTHNVAAGFLTSI